MLTLKKLRESLAECHVTESTLVFKTLKEVTDPNYFILRATEAINEAKATPFSAAKVNQLTLAIQLLNMQRVLLLESSSGPSEAEAE